MFVSKAGSYLNEAPFRCPTLGWALAITQKLFAEYKLKNTAFVHAATWWQNLELISHNLKKNSLNLYRLVLFDFPCQRKTKV
jgi:hypothetical protein